MLKGPKEEKDKTKLRQVACGTSTDANMRCTHTRKFKQSSFNRTKRNCSVEATSQRKHWKQPSRVTDEERRNVGVSNPSDVIKSINDVKVLPKQSNNGSVKATSKSNRTTASSKSSNVKRILLLELEAMKKQNEIDEQLAAARRKAEIRKIQEEMDMRIIAEELKIGRLEEESARTEQVANQEIELARIIIQLRRTQSQKVTNKLQPCEGRQKCYRSFKASFTSTKPLTRKKLRERSAHSQKSINGVTSKESHLRSNNDISFGRIDTRCSVGSLWHSNHESVGKSSMMRTVKQTQTRQTSSKDSLSDHNESLKRTDELMVQQEEMALLKALDWKIKGKCTMKK